MKRFATMAGACTGLAAVVALSAASMMSSATHSTAVQTGNSLPISVSLNGDPIMFSDYHVLTTENVATTNGVPISISIGHVPTALLTTNGVPISISTPPIDPLSGSTQVSTSVMVYATNGVPISISADATTTVHDDADQLLATVSSGSPAVIQAELAPLKVSVGEEPVYISAAGAPLIFITEGAPLVVRRGEGDFDDPRADIVRVSVGMDHSHPDAGTAGFRLLLSHESGAAGGSGEYTMVMELEDEFETSIPDEEAEKIQTIGEYVGLLVN